MGLYENNGYVNIDYILSKNCVFNFIVGGRGTGKTYGSIKYMIKHNYKCMLMRRMQRQTDLINKKEFSPVAPVCDDLGIEWKSENLAPGSSGIYLEEDNEPLFVTSALSTISNMRGFDASSIEFLIFDEFIPQEQERPIKNEAEAFFNAYETINRNRELQGRQPLKVLLLANSNNIINPLFMNLHLIEKVQKMGDKNQSEWWDKNRSLALFMLSDSDISFQKSNTALYKLASNSAFSKMALDNKFNDDSRSNIKKVPLREYTLIAKVGELCVYTHKSKNELYGCFHESGTCVRIFGTNDVEKKRAKLHCRDLVKSYLCHNFYFENTYAEALFLQYFDV